MRFLFLLVLLASTYPLSGQVAWNVSLESTWSDTTVPLGDLFYNEIWAWEQDGREYAILGAFNGHYIVDITDPNAPVQASFIRGVHQYAIHRDMKTYGPYLYMVSDEDPFGLMIADLSHLPDSAPVVYVSDTFFERSHNIFIDTATAVLYTFTQSGPTGFNNGVTAYSLADPLAPVYLGEWRPASGYAHDGYARNDSVFVNAWSTGLSVIDFTDPIQPTPIAAYPLYPGAIANHSGWLDPDRGLYAMADEVADTDIKLMDVSDYNNFQITATFRPDGTASNVIPHNLMFRDEFLYISSYTSGLRIFNTTDPSQPILVGYYDTYPVAPMDPYDGAWGIYSLLPSGRILVSDQNFGLFVLNPQDALTASAPPQPLKAEVWPVPARDQVYFRAAASEGSYRLLDQWGQILQEAPWTAIPTAIDLAQYAPGVYFLEINSEGMTPARHKLIHY